MQRPLAALLALALLAPVGGHAFNLRPDAKLTTFLEYSRNLVAHYPLALQRRIDDMQRRASVALSPRELCARAIEQVPGDLEENPNREIALIGAQPLGRVPDAWESAALRRMAAEGGHAHHGFVQAPSGELFRYVERLERLASPCDGVADSAADPPAVSILRRAGPAAGAAPVRREPSLRLPHPSRQGPRR